MTTGVHERRKATYHVILERELCKGEACSLCFHVCPKGVFGPAEDLTPSGILPLEARHPDACIGCARCETLCPELAIDVLPAGVQPPVWESPATASLPPPGAAGGWAIRPSALPAGSYFFSGNQACAEGAIAAGCRFYAGYPITPSSEAMLHFSRRLPEIDGTFIQMEDEIGSLAAVIGASWAGVKAMTATSGPGLSLMLENLGYALMTETPLVILNAQRAGPSTGQSSRPAQGDVMQARWGTHGGAETIALAPWSVQEMYDLTLRAFNLSERFRTPVILLADEIIAHLMETVVIPRQITCYERVRWPQDSPFGCDEPAGVPPMPALGEGARLLVTGSTHDGRGFRRTADPVAQERLTRRLARKITDHLDEIADWEAYHVEDATHLVIAYGSTARGALWAVAKAREKGLRAGLLRLRCLWPFPDQPVTSLLQGRRAVIVPEANLGQMCREVSRCAGAPVTSLTQHDGEIIDPRRILGYLIDGKWER